MSLPTCRSARPPAPSFALRATAVAAAALVLAACGGKEAPKPPPVPEVSVAEVIQRDQPILSELTGTMRGFDDIEIRARVEGFLRSVDYREGSEVKKGQLLFTIDDQPYRAKLAEAKGELARAESTLSKATLDVKRFKPLAEQRAVSQAELDNAVALQRSARAQVDAAKANVEKAMLDVGYTRLASPINGLAGQAQRKVGDLVGKGESDAPHHRLVDRPGPRQREPPGGAVPQVREPAAGVGRHRSTQGERRSTRGRSWSSATGRSIRSAASSSSSTAPSTRRPEPCAPTSPSATRRRSSGPASTRRCGTARRSARGRCSCRSARSPSSRASTPWWW